jgi:hypothetical protein
MASCAEPHPQTERKPLENISLILSQDVKSTTSLKKEMATESTDFSEHTSPGEPDMRSSPRRYMNDDGPREQPKILFSQRKLKALQHFAILHLPPIAGVFVIMGLYIAQIGWIPDSNVLSILVFVAKVHESLILVSLADILYHRIRHGLMTSRGVPFGFLTAPYYLSSPWTLFRPELMAQFRGVFWENASHFRLAVLLVVTLLFAMLTGLSSTILLVPRQEWWPLNRADPLNIYLANSFENLYPIEVTKDHGHPFCSVDPTMGRRMSYFYPTCLQFGLQSILNDFRSALDRNSSDRNFIVTSDYDRKVMVNWDGDTTLAMSPTAPPSNAVTAGYNLAHAIGERAINANASNQEMLRIESKAHDSSGIHLWKSPLVSAQCSQANKYDDNSDSWATFSFYSGMYDGIQVTLDQQTRNDHSSFLPARSMFLDIQSLIPFQISTAFLIDIPGDATVNHTYSLIPYKQLCLVDARWVESKLWVEPINPDTVQADIDIASHRPLKSVSPQDHQSDIIRLDSSWIESLNITYNHTTVQRGADWSINSSITVESAWNAFDLICSTNLVRHSSLSCNSFAYAVYITDALARHPYSFGAYSVYTVPDSHEQIGLWQVPIIQDNDTDIPLDFNASSSQAEREASHTRVELIYYQYMYSYRFRDLTVCLAMAVMLSYVVFVLCHFIVIVIGDGWHSKVWSELGEVYCLALQSSPNELLENTSAGVKHGDTWRLQAFIREARLGKKVELVLEINKKNNERESMRDKAPQPDIAYG